MLSFSSQFGVGKTVGLREEYLSAVVGRRVGDVVGAPVGQGVPGFGQSPLTLGRQQV